MSNVSTVYDALVTRIGTVLSSHRRLTNPYSIEQNMEQILKKGWGIAWGSGENTKRFLSDINSIKRLFPVIICREYKARELDITTKASTEKLLFEDQKLLITDFKNQNQLTVVQGINHVTFSSDEGIQKVAFEGKDQFLFLTSIFEVEYFET